MCFCDAAILLSPQLSLHCTACTAAPDHHEVSGPGDWYQARARGVSRHEASHLDQGFIALHPRGWAGDSAQTRSAPQSWIVSWMNWTKLNMKHVIIVASCWWRLWGTVWELWTSGKWSTFYPWSFSLYRNWTIKQKNIICDTGISWTTVRPAGDGFDCFFTFRRNSPSPGGGLWQPGSAAAWEHEEETSHVMRHQAAGPAGPGHCSIMSRGVIVHPNKVWRTNAEEILISFI